MMAQLSFKSKRGIQMDDIWRIVGVIILIVAVGGAIEQMIAYAVAQGTADALQELKDVHKVLDKILLLLENQEIDRRRAGQ
jgi:hypothetical protein